MNFVTLFLVVLLLPFQLKAEDRLSAEITSNSCIADMHWMRVDISVDDETFTLHPACNFEFNKEIQTSQGGVCTVKSRMCLHYELRDEITIECDFGETVVKDFPCDNW